jgi:hypothetical protein
VLKDIWIDSDRMREGNVLALLRAAANDEDRQLLVKHFLTIVCHGDVWTELGILDDTANDLMRGLKITADHDSLFKPQREPFIHNYEPRPGSHPRYTHKTRYRIVFKEKCITIYRMKSLPDVITVLTETVGGEF